MRVVPALLLIAILLTACQGPDPACDGCVPPVVTIDSPDQDDLYCDDFTVEGTARATNPGLASVTLYVDGEEVETVALSGEAMSYDFEFDVATDDFPAYCGEVEVEVVVTDDEGEEASENVDVVLCDDTTDPVVTMIADDDYLTGPDQCAHVTVTVVDDNFDHYEITGFDGVIVPTGSGFSFTVCCSDLNEGENSIEFCVTDICGNEGCDSITITCYPQEPVITNVAPADGSVLCEAATFQAEVEFQDRPPGVVEAVTFWICGVPYAGVLDGDYYEVSFDNAWEAFDEGCTWYATVESNVGNETSDPWAFTVDCDSHGPCGITSLDSEDCLCGIFSFLFECPDLWFPIEEVCFYFDGEDLPRYCDDDPPYEWIVDVNPAFEPETHTIFAMAVLEDGSGVPTPVIPWVKSCDPVAVLEVGLIDHINRTVMVDAGLSTDDNVEPGLTFEFWAEPNNDTCDGHWSHDQNGVANDSAVMFTFDPSECGPGDYEIFVRVFDGWCDGQGTTSIVVTFED
jgi:hypothetical protein